MTHEILTNAQMKNADRLTIAGGVGGYSLMQAAGRAVAGVVARHYAGRSVTVLCGPGNNGGDGYVAARALKESGFDVTIWSLADPQTLTGDARRAYQDWGGPVSRSFAVPDKPCVVLDAVFGTGFNKRLEDNILSVFEDIKKEKLSVVAVDVPSGVGDPNAMQAERTVTFFRKKLDHVLMPGLALCGAISVHDIGIPDSVLAQTGFAALENAPELWLAKLPRPEAAGHKYGRGHLAVLGGARLTGAARLASEAAMRAGAGLCTIAADPKTAEIYQKGAPHVMFEPLAALADFPAHLGDPRRTAAVAGPGAGLDDGIELRKAVQGVLKTGKPVVLDADALTVFAGDPGDFLKATHEKTVLTPHEGEFGKIFKNVQGNKLERALAAAQESGAVVLLKGPDTVIAAPDGRAVINIHASPWLATAGSGDVLAGIIGGFLAEGMAPFDAACAAAWIHGEAALRHGPGLVAPDIIEGIPGVMGIFFSSFP